MKLGKHKGCSGYSMQGSNFRFGQKFDIGTNPRTDGFANTDRSKGQPKAKATNTMEDGRLRKKMKQRGSVISN